MNPKTSIVCLALGVAILCLTECASGSTASTTDATGTTVSVGGTVTNVTVGSGVSTGLPSGGNGTLPTGTGSNPTGNGGNTAGRFAVPSLFTMMSIVCSILYGVNNQF